MFAFRVDGAEAIINKFKNKRQILNNGRGALYPQISDVVQTSISRNFDSGGRPRWRPRTRNYSWPILQKTRKMRRRAEQTALTGWFHRAGKHVLNIMSPYYGVYHQNGTQKLPRRSFVKLQPYGKETIMQVIIAFFKLD